MLQQSPTSIIRRRAPKPRQRTLNQSKAHALIKPSDSPLLVQRCNRLSKRRAVTILVVADGAKPHQGDDLQSPSERAGDAAA